MIESAVIMFVAAVLVLIFAIEMRKGNTKLIQDYHQSRVKRKEFLEYSSAFANSLFVMSGTLALTAIIGLFGYLGQSIIVFVVGLVVTLVIIYRAQKKHNDGTF